MNKEITLKSLTLENFKGIKKLSIDFGNTTNIYGENGVGKTTVFDAITWLLFDKDSTDRKQFEVKTLDRNGSVIHGLDHTVEGILDIDGTSMTLTKTYKEKWTKKRGEANKTLTGHETLYSIDEVPVNKSEYVWQIQKFIDENLFKLLTSPLYFNTHLKWQDRRNMLLEVIGDIQDTEVISNKNSLSILNDLLGGKDIETLKKSLAARRKKLNESIKAIPIRIDEINNSLQEDEYMDIDTIKANIEHLSSEIERIDSYIADESKVNDEKLKVQQKVFEIKTKIKDIEYQAKSEAEKPLSDMNINLIKVKGNKQGAESNIKQLENSKSRIEKQMNDLSAEILDLREKWNLINQEEINISEDNFVCSTCKRALEADDIEQKKNELQENFNKNKSKRLSDISQEGKKKSAAMEDFEEELRDIGKNIDKFASQLNSWTEEEMNLKKL